MSNPIEQEAINLFQKNLKYFEKEQKKVYQRVAILSQAIADNTYTERYSLEYLDNYFDILELGSGNYLYGSNSLKNAKALAKKVNYKKSDSVVEGFYERRELSDEAVKIFDTTVNLKNQLYASAKIIQYNKLVTSKSDNMRKIIKYIYSGIGLGFHITEIQKKTKASVIFLVEKNLELFRLSLFTTDYTKLALKATLFFSILDDDNDTESFNAFLLKESIYNQYMKYTNLFTSNIDNIKKIQTAIVKSIHLIRPYNKSLREFLKAPEYLVEKYPFISFEEYKNLKKPFEEKPLLLIASGPSLDHNAKWLQKNQNKFFIVTVFSSILTLHKLKVKPDLVIHIDSEYDDVTFLHGIDISSFFKQTLFLLSSVVAKAISEKIPKENLYFFESASSYKKNSKVPPAPSIGETSYFFALIFGVKQLYLLGLDLALDPESKSNHTKGHKEYREIKENNKENEQYTSFQNTILYTKGNFSDEVPTTALYQMSVNAFSIISSKYKDDNTKVFNLNNGAYLQGAKPLHIEDLDIDLFQIVNKKQEFENLKTFFHTISENSLNKDELLNFKQQIDEAIRVLKEVEDFQTKVNTTGYIKYLSHFHSLYINILNAHTGKTYDINTILYLYLQQVVGYIFDILNSDLEGNEKEYIKNINNILIEQLKKIINLYIKTMKIYVKWMLK